ncbi:hypothetical protein vseg_017136 [Gypsophila vaccaria]
MLEHPSVSFSEHEHNLMDIDFRLCETSKSKRKSEDGENLGNSLKLLKIDKSEEMEVDFLNLSLSLIVHQSYMNNANNNNNNNDDDEAEDRFDTSSLIHQIGRDNSISCIAYCSRSDYGSIASLNRSFRSLIESNELYKLRRKIGMVEHWVYISCSLLGWEVFDPFYRRWKQLPRMPFIDSFMHSDKESLAVGTELLVFGMGLTTHLTYKYSLLTNSWSSGTEMNTPRCLFGSSTLGEIAICAGGCDVWGNVFSSAELYNSETGMWEILPSMNKARKKCSAVFMDKKFYVLGGFGVGNSDPFTCGEVYDLERRAWTEIPNMLPLRNDMSEAPPLLTVVNDELYAADYARKEISKYNKSSNSWAIVGSLPERAMSMNGWGLAFRGCGNQLTVIGGPRALDGGFIEVNACDPSQSPQQWTVIGRKHSGGFVYNCAVMGC